MSASQSMRLALISELKRPITMWVCMEECAGWVLKLSFSQSPFTSPYTIVSQTANLVPIVSDYRAAYSGCPLRTDTDRDGGSLEADGELDSSG